MGFVELLIVVVFVIALLALATGGRGKGVGKRDRSFPVFRQRDPEDRADPRNQIRFVEDAEFKPVKLMGREEFYTFVILQAWQKRNGPADCRLFVQVCYGSFLKSADEKARASINSKRADFLYIDRFGNPIMVVEYQGTGHWQGNAALRDKVKARALEKAGIPLVEIFPKDGEQAIFSKLDAACKPTLPTARRADVEMHEA